MFSEELNFRVLATIVELALVSGCDDGHLSIISVICLFSVL